MVYLPMILGKKATTVYVGSLICIVLEVWKNLANLNNYQRDMDILNVDNPIEGTIGSPMYIEVESTAGDAIATDGPLTVSGYTRVA